ncbi:MAG: hypothetical protein AB7T49_06830 [Oligoflexales bacterium]
MYQHLLVILALFVCACKQSGNNSQIKEVHEGEFIPNDNPCKANETQYIFGMGDTGLAITREDIALEGEISPGKVMLEGWERMKIDLCESADGTMRIERAFKQLPRAGGWITTGTIFKPSPNDVQRGVEQALFNQDLTEVFVTFYNEENPGQSYLLKGNMTKKGKEKCKDGVPNNVEPKIYCEHFLSLSPYDASVPSPVPTKVVPLEEGKPAPVELGELVDFDPFVPRYTERRKMIDRSGIKLKIWYGFAGKPGLYLSYKFSKVELWDNHLPEPVHILVTEDQVSNVAKTMTSHHGLNDKFKFIFPHGTYIFRSSQDGDSLLEADYNDPTITDSSAGAPCPGKYLQECGIDFTD